MAMIGAAEESATPKAEIQWGETIRGCEGFDLVAVESRLADLAMFSTDYPHWQFDGDEVLPKGLSADLVRKIMIDNPMATYGRLAQSATKEKTP